MSKYSQSQVKENRIKWANFLLEPGRLKGTGKLDAGNGERCCLGHGAFILDLPATLSPYSDVVRYGKAEVGEYAPREMAEMLGLWSTSGTCHNGGLDFNIETGTIVHRDDHSYSLANINDLTVATPKEIGAYLLSVIEGGSKTPFRYLSDYPE